MSKLSKKQIKRRMDARAAREAQRLRYQGYAAQGRNKKSARFRRGLRAQRVLNPIKHAQACCGNVGCRRCFPALADAHG